MAHNNEPCPECGDGENFPPSDCPRCRDTIRREMHEVWRDMPAPKEEETPPLEKKRPEETPF